MIGSAGSTIKGGSEIERSAVIGYPVVSVYLGHE